VDTWQMLVVRVDLGAEFRVFDVWTFGFAG